MAKRPPSDPPASFASSERTGARPVLPCVVIVGRPNVGKSTLFNRLCRRRVAVVESDPGITRDRLYYECEWAGKRFELVDTGGILFTDEEHLIEQIRLQAQIAIAEAEVVLFMADAMDGITPPDQELADELRRIRKPIIVVANKADSVARDQLATDFYGLGFGEVSAISALNGRGVAELFDRVAELLPEAQKTEQEDRGATRIAILGRPNVGKSSLLNAFIGEERAIVSETPGTTRDALDTELEYKGETITMVDTAGLRRRGKIQGSVEYYMALRAIQAMKRADLALAVIDGAEGLTDGDKRVAKAAHVAGKACVFAVNKWDMVEPPDGCPKKRSQLKKDFVKVIRNEFPELSYAPICFTSATESTGLEAALDTCLSAMESYHFRMSTAALNRIVRDAVYEKPYTSKGKALRIYYATQTSTAPPSFLLFCNNPRIVHFSYKRYIENRIRKEFALEGAPIRIDFRSSHGKEKR